MATCLSNGYCDACSELTHCNLWSYIIMMRKQMHTILGQMSGHVLIYRYCIIIMVNSGICDDDAAHFGIKRFTYQFICTIPGILIPYYVINLINLIFGLLFFQSFRLNKCFRIGILCSSCQMRHK